MRKRLKPVGDRSYKKFNDKGEIALYMTRKAALRKLCVTLKQFKTLCILKGIFPRQPQNAGDKYHGKMFYFIKDIRHIFHDPMCSVIRERFTIETLIKKYTVLEDVERVKTLMAKMPDFNLKEIVKERYPTFIDALRDLDDALSMLYIFEHYPKTHDDLGKHMHGILANIPRKLREFEAYLVKSNSLTKTFVSIKGTYYQASIMGQEITWLVPHRFVREAQADETIDMSIIYDFLKFYDTLFAYVLFKLFTDLGYRYPPNLENAVEGEGQLDDLLNRFKKTGDTGNQRVQFASSKSDSHELTETQKDSEKRISTLDTTSLMILDSKTTEEEKEGDAEKTKITTELDSIFAQDQQRILEFSRKKLLFEGKKFFLSRETPRASLDFVIRAFGGKVSWEGGPFEESDEDITHCIIDAASKKRTFLGRNYVQPQWIYDCVNNNFILPEHEYGFGAALPPHLSPFVDNAKEGYIPPRQVQIDRIKTAMETGIPIDELENEEEDDEDSEDEGEGSGDEEVEKEEKPKPKQVKRKTEDLESLYSAELKAEIQGKTFNEDEAVQRRESFAQKKRKLEQEEEQKEKEMMYLHQKRLLARQDRLTLERKEKVANAKEEAANLLKQKRKEIKKANAKQNKTKK